MIQQRLDHLDGLSDDACQLERSLLELNAALGDARHIEQIVHEPGQVIDLTLDHPHAALGGAFLGQGT